MQEKNAWGRGCGMDDLAPPAVEFDGCRAFVVRSLGMDGARRFDRKARKDRRGFHDLPIEARTTAENRPAHFDGLIPERSERRGSVFASFAFALRSTATFRLSCEDAETGQT
jgi:hypothetical protein